jgi:hypothetical protein
MNDKQVLAVLLELDLQRSRSAGPVPPGADDEAEGGE